MPARFRRLRRCAAMALFGALLLGPMPAGTGVLPTLWRPPAAALAAAPPAAGPADAAIVDPSAAAPPAAALPPGAAPGAAGAIPPPPAPPTGAPDVIIEGSGWGHSVGLSQYGARAMALDGRNAAQILAHYYPGAALGSVRNAAPPIRVNLFVDRGVDASRVLLQSVGRNGGAPTHPIAVDLAGTQTVAVPAGQTWQVVPDGTGLALQDAAGTVQLRGGSPARVRFAFDGANPTLLRLPQLAATGAGGTYQWGELEIHRTGATLQPVLAVEVEQYLRGVAEMPGDWPAEALRAQAITARTFALRHMQAGVQPGCACHLGSTQLHQVYAGWIAERGAPGWPRAVAATAGQVVSYQGRLAWTYFSSSHGGRSEDSELSWAYPEAIPYLRSVDDSWSRRPEAENPYASWRRAIPNARFAQALGLGFAEVRAVRILSRTAGGTPLELEVTGVGRDGVERVARWTGARKGIAGADLKLLFRAELPSQQISTIELAPLFEVPAPPEG